MCNTNPLLTVPEKRFTTSRNVKLWESTELLELLMIALDAKHKALDSFNFNIVGRSNKTCVSKLKNEKRRMQELGWDYDWKTVVVACTIDYLDSDRFNMLSDNEVYKRIKTLLSEIYFSVSSLTRLPRIQLHALRNRIQHIFHGCLPTASIPKENITAAIVQPEDTCLNSAQESSFDWKPFIVFGLNSFTSNMPEQKL